MPGEDFHLSDYPRFQAHTFHSYGVGIVPEFRSLNIAVPWSENCD